MPAGLGKLRLTVGSGALGQLQIPSGASANDRPDLSSRDLAHQPADSARAPAAAGGGSSLDASVCLSLPSGSRIVAYMPSGSSWCSAITVTCSKAARGWEQAVAAARAGGSHLHRGCPAVARVERALPAREPRAARFASRRSTALVLATAPPPPRLLLLLPVALRLRLGTGAGAPPALLRLLRSPHHLVESVGRRQRLAARAAVGERLCGVEDRRPSAVRQQSGARADDEEMAPAKGAARVSRGERGWRCGKALREGGGDAGYSRLPAAAPGAREHHIQPAWRGHKAEALRPAG